jgi:hypothetical protein
MSMVSFLNSHSHVLAVFVSRNMSKVKMHPSLQHGAVHEIHDIEDLVKIGKQVKGQFDCQFCERKWPLPVHHSTNLCTISCMQ